MRRNLYLLTTPVFLLGLLLLLANDFLFKPLFHNWLTGKLSDFAGLLIFPLCWTALMAGWKRAIYLLTALGFVFWKSIYSQPLIEGWNDLTPLTFAREADASDLIALIILAPSYLYHSRIMKHAAQNPSLRPDRRWAGCCVVALSLFAFTATSFSTRFDYSDQEFTFADSKAGLIKRFEKTPHTITHNNVWESPPGPDEYTMTIKTDLYCLEGISALVELKEQDAGRTRVILRRLQNRCPEKEGDREKMLQVFLHEVVERLQNDIEATPARKPRAKAAP